MMTTNDSHQQKTWVLTKHLRHSVLCDCSKDNFKTQSKFVKENFKLKKKNTRKVNFISAKVQ